MSFYFMCYVHSLRHVLGGREIKIKYPHSEIVYSSGKDKQNITNI